MIGWLVNDCLTCIPNVETFWHDLLKWLPNLYDKTFGYTCFDNLADKIETEQKIIGEPNYIIRNATFFRPIKTKAKTISILQDIYEGRLREKQIEVCNNSDIVVFNSSYTKLFYEDDIKTRIKVIPIGVDFEFFKNTGEKQMNVLPNSILFVGSADIHPKGFDILMQIIEKTNHNFCFVMKDNFKISHPRIRVFNSVNHELLKKIYNSCIILLCTSRQETLHLSGIEAAACNLPIITTNVGVYFDLRNIGEWGHKVKTVEDFIDKIEVVFKNRLSYNSRKVFLDHNLDKISCKYSWQNLIREII